MKKNKGFTLVELLAVIVILAIILVIAVPQIISTITESRKGALISSAKLIAASAESAYMSNQTLGMEKTITCSDVSKLSSEDYESCTITFDSSGKAKVTIVGKGKFEGMSVCGATRETGEVSSECTTDIACFAYDEIQQVSSFDINEEACKEYAAGQGTPTDVAETLCTGGEVGGSSLKGEIDAAIQAGSEEAISWISELETEGVISNVQYADSSISITGYSKTCPKDVIIPSKIDNKIVTAIGDDAFTTNGDEPNQIKHDLLYETYGVSTLYARNYSENIPQFISSSGPIVSGIGITSVIIPSSVTTIGNSAFYGNQLTSVTIPNSVTYIGDGAFRENQLSSVMLPDSVTTLESFVFSYNQLTSVTIPNSVATIGVDAFARNQLTSVTLPNSVTYIGSGAFRENQLTGVTIPNSVATIGGDAFARNQLTSVTLPNSVTYIGDGAFRENQLTSVMVPDSVTTLNSFVFSYNQLTSVTIPNTITNIGDYAFISNHLTSVTIPNSVTTIGDYAFKDNQLTSVTISDSVTTIGTYAFYGNQLTSVTIPNSVQTIGSKSFYKYIPYQGPSSNQNLTSIINTTGRSFDWSDIITGSSGTSSVTGTYNGVNVTTE